MNRRPRRLILITLVVLLTAAGVCATAAAIKGTTVPERHQVVVYYANETTTQAVQSANYATLHSILRSSQNPAAGMIADALDQDAKEFPAAVRHDVHELMAVANRRGFDLVVFTNALALDRQFLFYKGAGGTEEMRLLPTLPPAPSPSLASSPLSRPEYLQTALVEVGDLYAPDSLDVVLITNSHGADDLALTPRVFADLTIANAPDLLAALDRPVPETVTPQLWAAYPGTTKSAYWHALSEAGRLRGLRFPLIFRQACESGVSSLNELLELPDGVGTVAHTGDAMIGFYDIEVAALFDVDGEAAARLRHISEELRARGVHVDSRAMLGLELVRATLVHRYPFLLFLPLLAWLVWHGRVALAEWLFRRAEHVTRFRACRRTTAAR